MIDRYRTVRGAGSKEIVIKKSRFIGHVKPVDSEDDANAFIEEIKKLHWNATHNCSAYMIGERDEIQKQSDDGEPSGTAGKPILEVIRNQGLKNVAIVVTRYFGGIMLGAGGLIRAYTDGAVAAIEAGKRLRACFTARFLWKSTIPGWGRSRTSSGAVRSEWGKRCLRIRCG